jgi:hypothetical protein
LRSQLAIMVPRATPIKPANTVMTPKIKDILQAHRSTNNDNNNVYTAHTSRKKIDRLRFDWYPHADARVAWHGLPGDLSCIARWPNLNRTEAKPKKLSDKDQVSREATACPGECKATLSLLGIPKERGREGGLETPGAEIQMQTPSR